MVELSRWSKPGIVGLLFWTLGSFRLSCPIVVFIELSLFQLD